MDFKIRMKRLACLIGATLFVAASADAQKILIQEGSNPQLAPGFEINEEGGIIEPHFTDSETWNFVALNAWDWDWPRHCLISPTFTGDSFRIQFLIRNIQKPDNSNWSNIQIKFRGLEEEFRFYIGISDSNGELIPDFALYAEIQHPNKDNGYIWDSLVNNNNQPVPPPWSDYVIDYPDTIEIRMDFNGPNQPVDVYYNFDEMGWEKLLQWGDQEPANTFDLTLGPSGDPYQIAFGPMAGGVPPLEFDMVYFLIAGDIESEFAQDDETPVTEWAIY